MLKSSPFFWRRMSTRVQPPPSTWLERFRASPRFPLYRSILTTLPWLPVAFYFTEHVYSAAQISGESMQPTFNPNIQRDPLHHDVVLMEKWRGRYRRGDIVTLWSATNPELLTTKRIVALEGDIVTPLPPMPPAPIKIPPGHVWLEGDSAYRTRDSNTYGPVSLTLVNARVTRILWPRGRLGPLPRTAGKSEGRVRKLGPEWVDTR